MKLDRIEVQLSNGVNFNLLHNMPYNGLFSINDSLVAWLARTKDYAPENFVRYIRNKKVGYKVFTETQFENFLNNLNDKKNGTFRRNRG